MIMIMIMIMIIIIIIIIMITKIISHSLSCCGNFF